jgi:flagellar biosynthesis/type III secretory pathway protein FliH
MEKGIKKGKRLGIEKGERLGIEKGKQLGIEKGERLGRLEHAKATLARLDAKAATELASCDDVRLLDDAIDVAIQRLTSAQAE